MAVRQITGMPYSFSFGSSVKPSTPGSIMSSIVVLPLQRIPDRKPIIKRCDSVACAFQVPFQRLGDCRVILDDKDSIFHNPHLQMVCACFYCQYTIVFGLRDYQNITVFDLFPGSPQFMR